METNPQLEQTYEEALVIPRWLWSTVVGLVLIAGGVWLILSRFPISTGYVKNQRKICEICVHPFNI